jgi:hypothetical protein
MVPVRDFSGLMNWAWALASAAAIVPIVSHGLCDRLRIAEVTLLSPRVWAHITLPASTELVTQRFELPTKVMCSNVRLHADQARRHIRQSRFDLNTRPFLTQYHSPATISPDDMECVFADINADHDNCAVEALGHDVLLRLWSPLSDHSIDGH